ncbi:NucA/NucB deoxyribonuclease domain-containing protein [Streptacidiphilus neutrinimicus]|uniref:NucA/NucB deoxyribonuclease domain-containing protein n=1 Tax=Streptacidiphilus neutrinimicus TaxID=105420 RepID=UPI0005AB6696|nr:NucA/NucB deoxyribonuclease domain-containing protein [Streptacidiphilus neutrinimicus]
MTHPIAKALEEAAARVGRSLSHDAAEAVADMYHSVGHGTEQVVKNIADADARHAHELVSLAEKIAKNDGKTGRGARKRIRTQAAARSKIDAALGGQRDYDVELVVDASKYPESALHIQEAQSGITHHGPDVPLTGSPHPSVLDIDRAGADDRRTASLAGIPTRPPDDRDEYPPAMFKQGGAGASVKYIPDSDNRGSGSAMGSALNSLPDGTRVKITIR